MREGTTLANYAYLSDGTKLSATDAEGNGLFRFFGISQTGQQPFAGERRIQQRPVRDDRQRHGAALFPDRSSGQRPRRGRYQWRS